MKYSNIRFSLDIQSTQSQVSIPVSLNDTARVFNISLTDGSAPYTIADGCLAVISIKRPSGTHIEAFCVIENNTTIKYDFAKNPDTAIVEGLHDCQVTLYDADDKNVASAWFSMVVHDRVVNSNDIVLTDKDRTAVDSMLAKEAARQVDENERVAAEAERVSAEAERISAEAERVEYHTDLVDRVNKGEFTGDSAYEIAVMHGFEGTEEEWLDSLTQETADKAELMIAEKKAEALASIEEKGAETQAVVIDEINAAKAEALEAIEEAEAEAVDSYKVEYEDLDDQLKKCVNPVTNLIVNGNGKNGTEGWANSNGSTVEAIEDGVKYSQASATSAAYLDVTFCKITDMEAVSAGDILFQYADMMADGVAPTTLRLAIENRNAAECTVRVDHPTTDTWYQMYRRHTVTESQISDNSLNPRLFAEWSTSADRKASCVYVKNAIIINLTKTYGAGNEPSNEEMLALIQANGGYIDGTLNLFDAKTMMERQDTVEGRVGDLEDRVDELGDGIPADVEERMSALEDSVPSRLVRNLAYKVVSDTKTGAGGGAALTGASGYIKNTSGGYVTAFTEGHLYYAHCNLSIDSDCDIMVRFGTNQGAWGIKTLTVEANKAYPVSLCYTGNGDETWKWQVEFASAEEQNGKTLTCTKIFLCDLTELFGEGVEPPAAYMDKLVNYNDINLATEYVNLLNGGLIGDTCARSLRGSKESLYLDDQNGVPYVETTDEGNVVISSTPKYDWSNWSKQEYKYGMTAVRNTPIYNYVHGVLETDAMFSVQALYGRWTQNATNGTGAHPYGGHVFEAWNAPRTYRYTVLIGKNEETEACAFTFSPLSGGGGGNFGTLRLGSDITGQGLLCGQTYAEMGGNFTVNGKLNVKQRTIASSTAEGMAGEICFDSNYVYVCVATNTWKRFALSSW